MLIGWLIIAGFSGMVLGSLFYSLMYSIQAPPEDDIRRCRREALGRLRGIPFTLSYRRAATLMTSEGSRRYYTLDLAPADEQDPLLGAVLAHADLDFAFRCDLPAAEDLAIRTRRVSVAGIERADGGRPLVHIAIEAWEEAPGGVSAASADGHPALGERAGRWFPAS